MIRVFLVEDDEQMREALSRMLAGLGSVDLVGHAEREDLAVTWLLSNRDGWDLSIIDLTLAEGSGLRVLSSCRVRANHQRMVVLSNHVTKKSARHCLDLGADATFDKVSGLEDLFAYCQAMARSP
jgi:DNA-binding NarL/FixJ family response regulator